LNRHEDLIGRIRRLENVTGDDPAYFVKLSEIGAITTLDVVYPATPFGRNIGIVPIFAPDTQNERMSFCFKEGHQALILLIHLAISPFGANYILPDEHAVRNSIGQYITVLAPGECTPTVSQKSHKGA
jgi:hypothetical protein